jgi:hypothetical protein
VLCLLVAWLSFVWLMGFTIFNFVTDMIRHKNDRIEIILDSIIIAVVALKMMIFGLTGNLISFGTFVIWIFVEIAIVQVLCLINIQNWALNISGFLLCIGSSGTYLIWGTLRKQMSLACLGMTLKEQHSRAESAKLEFDHDPR